MAPSIRTPSAKSDDEPDILRELLVRSTTSAEAEQRWLDAAHRGFALYRLRQEGMRHGYVAFPVWEYLASLAKRAHVRLDSVLAAFDLDSRPAVSRQTAERIAEVLHRIGCGKDQALHMMRLSFAEVHGFSVGVDLAVLRRAGSTVQDVNLCEQALTRAERRYPEVLAAELDDVKAAAAARYENLL